MLRPRLARFVRYNSLTHHSVGFHLGEGPGHRSQSFPFSKARTKRALPYSRQARLDHGSFDERWFAPRCHRIIEEVRRRQGSKGKHTNPSKDEKAIAWLTKMAFSAPRSLPHAPRESMPASRPRPCPRVYPADYLAIRPSTKSAPKPHEVAQEVATIRPSTTPLLRGLPSSCPRQRHTPLLNQARPSARCAPRPDTLPQSRLLTKQVLRDSFAFLPTTPTLRVVKDMAIQVCCHQGMLPSRYVVI